MLHTSVTPDTVPAASNLLFDWDLDVERLEREAAGALRTRSPDPWTLAEAECSLDLIDAELVALRSKKDHPGYQRTLAHLEGLRVRVKRVIARLQQQ